MSKALEAAIARVEMIFHGSTFKQPSDYSVLGYEVMLLIDDFPAVPLSYAIEKAISAYLSHLAEDEAVVRVAGEAVYNATPFKETAGGYDQQSDTYRRLCETLARSVLKSLAGKE